MFPQAELELSSFRFLSTELQHQETDHSCSPSPQYWLISFQVTQVSYHKSLCSNFSDEKASFSKSLKGLSLKQKIFFPAYKLPMLLSNCNTDLCQWQRPRVTNPSTATSKGKISFSKYLRGFEGKRDVTTAINSNAGSHAHKWSGKASDSNAEAMVLRAVPGQYSLVCANFSSAISAKSITVGWDWKF